MANGHGGKRQGAGRKPGSASQKTREIANQAVKDGLTPLEYMLAVLRDDAADPNRRDRMAVAAVLDDPRLGVGFGGADRGRMSLHGEALSPYGTIRQVASA